MAFDRVVHLGPGLVVGEFGPICVTIWRDSVDLARFQKQAEGVAAIAAKYPGKGAFVCIIEPTCEPPNDQLRKASVELINAHDDKLSCIAGVIEGQGFRPAIARSILVTMALLFRKRAPHQFFSDVRGAAKWVGKHVDVDAARFITVVEGWRSTMEPPLTPLA